jgi:putative methyltransferase (TIGR04325 family)
VNLSIASLKERLKNMPPLRPVLEVLYERRFTHEGTGCFRGVFPTFAEADASAPSTKPRGFDHSQYALEFADRRSRIFSFDYPMLFWLGKILRPRFSIFDYGGHLGTHFYAYAKYLDYPPGLRWMVYDLPAITRAGEELMRQNGARGLEFTNRFEEADGTDILIAAGSLQYVEQPRLPVLLRRLERPPAHLLLNKLPLYDGPEFVTLQNGGAAFHPQHVFNRNEFVESLEAIGYRLKDEWNVETHPGYIPFHPDFSFRCHRGLYFAADVVPSAITGSKSIGRSGR